MTAASHVTPPQQIGIGKRRLRAKTSVKYQQTVQTEELWFVFFFWTEAGFKVYEVRQMWRHQKCDLALRKSVKWGADWCNVIKCCLNNWLDLPNSNCTNSSANHSNSCSKAKIIFHCVCSSFDVMKFHHRNPHAPPTSQTESDPTAAAGHLTISILTWSSSSSLTSSSHYSLIIKSNLKEQSGIYEIILCFLRGRLTA